MRYNNSVPKTFQQLATADQLQQRFDAPTSNRLIVTFNLLCNFARHFAPVHLTVASRDKPGCMRATAIAV